MKRFSNSALKWLVSILKERFGYDFSLEQNDNSLVLLLADDREGSIVFPNLTNEFMRAASDLPCTEWDFYDGGWHRPLGKPLTAPGFSTLTSPLIEKQDSSYIVHYDVLGLVYWMLNRIEEIDRTDLDKHGRFPAVNSHAYVHGYLERPVVDEWLHILGQIIEMQWPHLALKEHKFQIKVSHDVDMPSRYGFRSMKGMIRGVLGDILVRKNFKSAFIAPWIRLTTKNKIHNKDPFNTFNWIMDQSEKNELKSAFYFICGRTDFQKDADYEIEHPAIRELMRTIHFRGHEIGLHPSYNSYLNPSALLNESMRLKKVMQEEGIDQVGVGGRMHYLRWSHPETLQSWNEASMTYDSTLGYADKSGFRCGTCFEYPGFNSISQEQLSIRIRPLIVMDITVISDDYEGLGLGSEVNEKILFIKKNCQKVSGTFTVLWHNNTLTSSSEKSVYINAINNNE